MTRVAIVAPTEKLRASLAAALRANPEFEVIGASASSADLPPSADLVLIARLTPLSRRTSFSGEGGKEAVLSNREREILALLADGLVNKQIAARLGISTNTVKTHLELLCDKLGVATRAEAVATRVKRGLLLL